MAFGIALGLAIMVLAINGVDADSLVLALQLTARWSFLVFWMAYTGSAMATLFGPALLPLARRGREFGLAYAAAQLIHVSLVVWLFQISARPPLSGRAIAFFTIGIVWTYLLATVSFGGLAEAIGRRAWHALRVIGLNYILFAFAFDFVHAVTRPGTIDSSVWGLIKYIPFAAMSIAAPLLVLASAAHRRSEKRQVGVREASSR